MKTVIMAGGKGTRISAIAADIPKPMIEIDGKPILEHEMECLRDQGFDDIIITVSHLGQVIMDYFGDGSKMSVNIEYYFEKEPLGNAGALFRLRHRLTEDFLLLNADSIFDVDFKRFADYHNHCKGLATIFTHPNNHPYDSGLIITGQNHTVCQWLTKEEIRPVYYKNRVNAGIHMISPKLLNMETDSSKVDLDRQILKPLAGTGKLYAYDSTEYVSDMGTPERLERVRMDFRNGKVRHKNLRQPQKAIFLDRDGTINRYVGFLNRIEDFELLPRVDEAIKKINATEYLAVVITNQPVVARGEVTEEQLNEIHNKMETLLGMRGAYLDALYYCPHHPDSGFPGEVKALKIDCQCRKPKPGMLYQAAKEFNIDLSQSWFVGDGKNDILAGKAAGCRTALIGENDYGQDLSVKSLYDFVEKVLGSDGGR